MFIWSHLSRFSEAKCLRDEDILQTLPVGTTASFYFSDLGPQVTWGTVSVFSGSVACLSQCFTLYRELWYTVQGVFIFIITFLCYPVTKKKTATGHFHVGIQICDVIL